MVRSISLPDRRVGCARDLPFVHPMSHKSVTHYRNYLMLVLTAFRKPVIIIQANRCVVESCVVNCTTLHNVFNVVECLFSQEIGLLRFS
jgi:hypothetical protein